MSAWAAFVAMAAGFLWLLLREEDRAMMVLWLAAGLGCAGMALAVGIGGA